MKSLSLLALAAMAPSAMAAAAGPEQEIVVRGAAARAEIERILDADNLDTARLSPSEVVERMSAIARGHAPEDFWNAYQAHLQAWIRLAGEVDRARRQPDATATIEDPALQRAAAAIGTTFDEVERIAHLYHARLPAPRVDTHAIA